MRKIFSIILLVLMLLSISRVNALCCEDPGTKQCKCWASGNCCFVSNNLPCASSCDGSCYWSPNPCTGGTTTTSGCNNNTKCEFSRSENQENCPQDCKTTLTVYTESNEIVAPTTNLMPNQKLKLVLTFGDSRYNSSQGFNLRLDVTIDGNPWTINNGCKACNKSLSDMECVVSKKSWYSKYYEMNISMEDGYAEIEFNATLPSTLTPGTHKIKVTPVILGSLIPLRAVEVQFRVGDGLYTFAIIVKNIFNRLTGLFIYP